MGEDFSKYPTTIGEIRSDKTGDGEDWTGRDALISLLRRIDSGEISPTGVIAFYNANDRPGWSAGGCGPFELTGIAQHGLSAYIAACQGRQI